MTNDEAESRIREARRRSIDRACELYVLVTESDTGRIKLNSALLAEMKEMRFFDGADLREWAQTFGTKLSRLKRACGQCRPRYDTCQHADALLKAARLHNVITSSRTTAGVYDKQLGSQTVRKRMAPVAVRKAEDGRAEARTRESAAVEMLRSLVHTSAFLDAHDLFALACGDALAYCLIEDRRN